VSWNRRGEMTEIAGWLRSWVLRIAGLTARWLPQGAKRWLYRLGPVTRALRSTLNRAAPTGWTDVRVAAGELSGMWLSLDLQSEKDYWLGTYEPDLQAAVRDLVRPGMTVYDLGANIGYLTLLFATAVGTEGRVVAFEPLPSNLERLKAHVARNSLGSRVTIVPAATADRRGRRRFHVRVSGGMGKLEGAAGRPVQGGHSIVVETIDLDSYVAGWKGQPPDVIKIDIEGGEILALPGMRRILRQARPAILLEVHGPQAARVIRQEMENAHYVLHHLRRPYPALRLSDEMAWKSYLLALPQAVTR